MASKGYFDFLGPVWTQLSTHDRDLLGELWQGYEQVFGSVYQKMAENTLNTSIQEMLPFSTERWLPYTFSEENFIIQAAEFTSTQDISQGVNLTARYLLRLQVDDGAVFEVNIQGANPIQTTMSEIVSKINAAAGFQFARGLIENSVLNLKSNTVGVDSKITIHPTSIPTANAAEFILGILAETEPVVIPEYPWCYSIPYERVVEIPEFTDFIRRENVQVKLITAVDYAILNGRVCFRNEPPGKLWAERTLIDQENPWNNFGFLMGIYQKNSPGYLTVLQGLWYAFWTGPKPENLRRSLYLLFGLPTAQADGTVTSVTSSTITVTANNGTERIFTIPTGLSATVQEGDEVERFQPLVNGIDIFDKINRPGFIEDEIGRAGIQRFLTDSASRGPGDTDETKAMRMLEEHTFLPQISVEAFVRPDINIGNVRLFLESIKPLSKTFLFQVIVGTFEDILDIQDSITQSIEIDVTPNVDSNQTTFAETSVLNDYESIDNGALDLDSDGVLMQELTEVEVYSFAVLTDSFTV